MCYISASELPPYKAKYNFESEEISITGIREFKRSQDEYEISFNASNLLASLFFSSRFTVNNSIVMPKTYDIEITPKFLKRDQSLVFDQKEGLLKSKGQNSWVVKMAESNIVFDPLNVQVMIRIFIKKGLKEFDLNIVEMENGGSKKYTFKTKGYEKCLVGTTEYKCLILERYRKDNERIVKYFLAEELEYMFVKIIDSSPVRTNKLELKEVLSFG